MVRTANKNKIRQDMSGVALQVLCYLLVGIFALICLFPFVLMITSSFMNEREILTEGFKLIPSEFDTSAMSFCSSIPRSSLMPMVSPSSLRYAAPLSASLSCR